MEKLLFIGFAIVAVISAIGVVVLRNPVRNALSLMVCFFHVACIFVLLRSPFLAVTQVFIYVGAVMVLFLFVVLVLDMRKVSLDRRSFAGGKFAYVLIPVALIESWFVITAGSFDSYAKGAPLAHETSVESIARALFTDYLFPFEAVSVLLLAAMVGAIVLARKKWN